MLQKSLFPNNQKNVVTHTYIGKIYLDFQKVFTPLCSRPLRSLKTSLRWLYSLSHCCVTLEVDRRVASLHENVTKHIQTRERTLVENTTLLHPFFRPDSF